MLNSFWRTSPDKKKLFWSFLDILKAFLLKFHEQLFRDLCHLGLASIKSRIWTFLRDQGFGCWFLKRQYSFQHVFHLLAQLIPNKGEGLSKDCLSIVQPIQLHRIQWTEFLFCFCCLSGKKSPFWIIFRCFSIYTQSIPEKENLWCFYFVSATHQTHQQGFSSSNKLF